MFVGGRAAKRAVHANAVVDRTTPLVPELCVMIGGAHLDVAGATSVIKIGAPSNKHIDGALTGPANVGLAELIKRLENT